MKKHISGILIIVVIFSMLFGCKGSKPAGDGAQNAEDMNSQTINTESTKQSDISIDPTDIFTEAGLSDELIKKYFSLIDLGVQLSAEDFVKLSTLTYSQMANYWGLYIKDYTVDEYILLIKKMNASDLSETQIYHYGSFMHQYTPDEYIKIIKDMSDAGLTESQIDNYANYYHHGIVPEKYISLFERFEDADAILNSYSYFEDKLSLADYFELVDKIRTATGEKTAMPINFLSDNLVFVQRNISTYNYTEQSIAILSLDGKIITDWNAEWGEYDIQYRAECGDYFFIITDARSNYYNCDVVNRNGQVISNIECKEKRYDIGEGYVFFSFGGDWGQIMNPQGEVIELQKASVSPTYCEKSMGALAEGDEIGRVSEGLFFGLSIGNKNTAAYYYNTNGEVVIDLSTRAVNFKITKLSDFSNGQARIEFEGADYKDYYAFIDKTGAFIGDPIVM